MNIIFISELAHQSLIDDMKAKGTVILVPKDQRFDHRISSHPDLVITIFDNTLVIDENAHPSIFRQLDALEIPYITGRADLGPVYPKDVSYNAVVTKDYLIHNLAFTNPLLLKYSEAMNKKRISVKQGYTKCSTVVVDHDTFITSDQGIYQAVKDHGKVLLVQPGHVHLEGYDFGFLGGTSGIIEDTLVFHGDLSKHPDFPIIKAFVETAQKKLLYYKDFPLTDIGSILVYEYKEVKKSMSPSNQRHVNIPIFISHEGCPNDCVFCNQRKITAKAKPMSLSEISEQIKTYCSTLDDKAFIELAFFGGSFTGIDVKLQEDYLKLAYEYKEAGVIQAIRLSTRPDYISPSILDRLKHYGVDIIELGVQSLNEDVLKASNRGHLTSHVYTAVRLIKEYGFQLGIQLMVGLPEDSKDKSLLSAKLTALLKPNFVRIYPALVIRETKLSELCKYGDYHPLSVAEAVDWTKEMYQVFIESRIPVIRMGLQPTELIAEGKEVLYGPFHPAFRQLVESAYFFDHMKDLLDKHSSKPGKVSRIEILCNPRDLSQVIGHKRSNILLLKNQYPDIQVIPDSRMKPMCIELKEVVE